MRAEDDVSQAERRRIIAEENGMRTFHGQAQAALDDERGGRYATGSGSKANVVGSSPIAYPQQPASSPWSRDACPPEPPLGYSVDEQEPVGEQFEIEASRSPPSSSAGSGGVDGGPNTDGTSEVRPATKFRRRF